MTSEVIRCWRKLLIFPELSTGGVNISVSAHETESGNCSEKGHKDKRQLTPSQREV